MDTAVFALLAGLLAVAAALLGVGLGRRFRPAIRDDGAALADARADLARLDERAAGLRIQLDAEIANRAAAEADARAMAAEAARLRQREADLSAQLAEVQQRLTGEFENIANRILKARSAELSEGSQKELGAVLEPLRQRLQEFQQRVETTFQAETREVLSLKEQIKLVLETSNAVGSKADGLANALRGQSHVRGRWGEVALERILEAAGLVDGRDYIVQGRGLGLRNEDGGLLKPDVVVQLPEGRTMVLDSKVPLIGYERLCEAGDEAARSTAGAQFVRDVKRHIDDLGGKSYQDSGRLAAHDCVLMFVPIEGALAAALTCDGELFLYGWNRRVVLVGPSTLLMTMRTVASLRRSEQHDRNAQEIAKLGSNLIDKLADSLADFNKVAGRLADAAHIHSEAMKRLTSGRGNALSLGDRIRKLGAKAKPFPNILVEGGAITEAEWSDEPIPVVGTGGGDALPDSLPRVAAE